MSNDRPKPSKRGEIAGKWIRHAILVDIQHLLASGEHILKSVVRILAEMKKSKHQSSISMPSELLGGLSGPLKPGSSPNPESSNNLSKSIGLTSAQKLIAALAVKILQEDHKHD